MRYVKQVDLVSLALLLLVYLLIYMSGGGVDEYVGASIFMGGWLIYYSFFYKNDQSPRY